MYIYVKVVTDHLVLIVEPNPNVIETELDNITADGAIWTVAKNERLNTNGAWGVTVEHFICEI